MNTERDQIICQLYVSGKTLQQLVKQFHITRQRVCQILEKAGIDRTNRKLLANKKVLFANVSKEVKEAIRQEAKLQGITMTALTAKVMHDMLIKCGYLKEAEEILYEK